jgi:hypothetical protein
MPYTSYLAQTSVSYGSTIQAQEKTDEAEKCFDVLVKLEAVAGSKNEVVQRGETM